MFPPVGCGGRFDAHVQTEDQNQRLRKNNKNNL